MRSLFFVPVSGDVDVAPAFPLPGEPVVPVRGDDGGVPRHSLWRKAGAPPGCGQQRGFEPRHVGEGVGARGWFRRWVRGGQFGTVHSGRRERDADTGGGRGFEAQVRIRCAGTRTAPPHLRVPPIMRGKAPGFRCCAGDSECCFAVRVAGIRAILYICSKAVCFLVSRPVVRPRCWPRPPGTRRRGL